MKRAHFILVIILSAIMAGCGDQRSSDEIITVDVLKSYPKKELILQDFLDVEYIPLDNSDEFVTRGLVGHISKNLIVVRNSGAGGDIFLFDRKTGKALRKINRRGQGPEDYTIPGSIVIDEENNEMFISDISSIVVYDLFGNFKRRFNSTDKYNYSKVVNYDRNHLFFEDGSYIYEEERKNRFRVMSKQDGSITKEIEIPYKRKVTEYFVSPDGNNSSGPRMQMLVPDHYNNNWTLIETSSDTIYRLLPDFSMIPMIVRTPSIQSMIPPETFITPFAFTEHYILLQTRSKDRDAFYPRKNLIWDKKEKAIFESFIYNTDFLNERPVIFEYENIIFPFSDSEIAFCERIEAHELVEAFKNGQLKGKLKEIAANMDDESNPVFMIAKHKK